MAQRASIFAPNQMSYAPTERVNLHSGLGRLISSGGGCSVSNDKDTILAA